MTTARLPLIVALLVAALLAVQIVVGLVVTVAYLGLGNGLGGDQGAVPAIFGSLMPSVIRAIVFAAGVWVSLRFVAPIRSADSWRGVIARGIVATLLGTAAVVVLGLVQALADSVNPASYPFGYSFSGTIDSANLGFGVLRAFEGAFDPIVNWIVPVVLAVVLLRVWLAAHPVSTEATDRASVAA